MPELEQLHQMYKDRGVKVIAVGNGGDGRINAIRSDKKLTLRIPRGTEVFRDAMAVEAFPETIFVDKNGRIAHRLQGGAKLEYFTTRVDGLLAEPVDPNAVAAPPGPAAATGEAHTLKAKTIYKAVQLFQ